MDRTTLRRLDFPLFLEILARRAPTDRARRSILALVPDAGKAEERRQWLPALQELLRQGVVLPFQDLPDLERILRLLAQRRSLPGLALRRVGEYLLVYETIFERLLGSAMSSFLPDPVPLVPLRRDLLHALDEEGKLRDHASPDLGPLRRKMQVVGDRLEARMQELLDQYDRKGWLRERFVTERNGRRVLPFYSHVSPPGIVHAFSNSEATLFVEPYEVVDLQNQWVRAKEAVREEEERILLDLTERVRRHREILEEVHARLEDLEVLESLARYAEETGAVLPEDASSFEMRGVDHPVLLEMLGRERVVPLDLSLEPGTRGMVLSGPNAGGKTVVLKTVGMAVLARMTGLPLPGKTLRLPRFRRVWAIGFEDPQNLQQQTSSFTGIVRELRTLLEEVGKGDLVLLDEPFASTDPQEGAALALAIVEALLDRGAHVWLTTHLGPLKHWAARLPGIQPAAMAFDPATGRPLYTLRPGEIGESHALDIVLREGMPGTIVARARELLREVDREVQDLKETLRQRLAEAEQKLASLRAREEETEQRLRRMEEKAQERLLQQLRRTENRLQEAIRMLQKELRTREDLERLRKTRRDLRREKQTVLRGSGGEPVLEPEIGKVYRVHGFGVVGELIALEGKRAILQVGDKRMEVPRGLLRQP